MERRKESLSVLKLCRFCLSQDGNLISLYERKRPQNAVTLPLKILSCTSIEIFPSDKMPSYICQRCKFFMDATYEYKQICREADENIIQFIQKGTPLETIKWPSILTEIYPLKSHKSEIAVLDSIEGAPTIQVTTQDESDSDEDENVIDIKIGDGSDEGSKGPSIKLITGGEDNEKKLPRSRKDSDEMECRRGPRGTRVGGKSFACDECDCSYPLQQLLGLHKLQKHPNKPFACDQCEDKFYSKYDLTAHQLQHTDDVLFKCVVCDMRFKRLILLKRHEKVMHSDLQQNVCPSCPATFLSLEELEMHQEKHKDQTDKQHYCTLCKKKFNTKATLQRHKDVIHPKHPELQCEYCPERYPTVSKLMRHVRTHAGERAYPCKYCDKSFLKSHHYTRHLRLKHRELARFPKERFHEFRDQEYRCEQCEETFNSQDDLIYHSAIHATQNLICPLCQEKFRDVDAVTTHIKSHVNGTEFMCDFCELVFTTQDKLYNHMTTSHDDEMHGDQENVEQEEGSSMDMEAEDDDDENALNVKEESDHMVVEIKKPDEFMLTSEPDERIENTNSEDSEMEATFVDLATVDTLSLAKENTETAEKPAKRIEAIITKVPETASILRKAEDIKLKVTQHQSTDGTSAQDKKTPAKSETSAPASANDKSLRLLEKDLQELKRTNTRSSDAVKVPAKPAEVLRNKRSLIRTSTPKPTRNAEEKKSQVLAKAAAIEKKQTEKRTLTKENKEPKEKIADKDEKEKEKETPKSNEKSTSEDNVRRSTRPSKIKDYAKMINDKSQNSDEDSDYNEDSEEEEPDPESSPESRPKGRRGSTRAAPVKATPAPSPSDTTTPVVKRRGRPRKDKGVTPAKIKKGNMEKDDDDSSKTENATPKPVDTETAKSNEDQPKTSQNNTSFVPVKSLPPGVKPLPLPANTRPVMSGELSGLQAGKRFVKVQKIVMTKAELEAMAKKGLVEVKGGTMVLKQGVKLPTSDPAMLKSTLFGDINITKESAVKKAAPTRCELEEA